MGVSRLDAGPVRDAIYGPAAERRNRIYRRYEHLKGVYWTRHLTPQAPRIDFAGEAYRRYAQLDRRGGREYDRAEHALHIALGEGGLYLWCAHCKGTQWRHWRDRGAI